MHRSNNMADLENYIRGLHPQQDIVVISDASYYYVDAPGVKIGTHQQVIYEGEAGNFTV